MKRLGPELKKPNLKMPELKAPTFLADLYYDLRDRRLLAPLALVVVAIAAVPFLLGNGEVEEPPLPVPDSAALEASTAKTSKLTVVEATPGLRDYRKRLRDRSPTDPFKQRFTGPVGGSASSSSGGDAVASSSESSSSNAFSEEVVTTESSATVEAETGGSSNGGSHGSSNGGRGSAPSAGVHLFEFVFDVQISHSEPTPGGGQKMSDPEVRHQVKTLAQLPSKKAPVVTVAGVNLHNGRVWFLASDEVKALDGEFTCVTRAPGGLCELLEIEPGFPLELTYGPDAILYRLKVTNVGTVSAGKVGDGSRSSRAAFGIPGESPGPLHSFSK